MGRKLVDLTGKKFGKLTVLQLSEERKPIGTGKSIVQWDCKCDCGAYVTVTGDYLRTKVSTPSCGCNKFVDSLVGQKFGDLIVESEYKKPNKKIRYICKCECGNSVDVDRYDLINGKRTNCGCKKIAERPNRIKDISGQKFGRLLVVEHDSNLYYTKGGNKIHKWICKCSCGNIVSVSRQALVGGRKKSCGCLLAEKQGINMDTYRERYKNLKYSTGTYKDLTGQRFGKLIVIERYFDTKGSSSGRAKFLCQCDCGNTTIVTGSNLSGGHTRSCGCIDSVGESLIGRFLCENNINFKKEHTFRGCRDSHPLPFDFAILDKDNTVLGIIEYDGLQHFQVVRFNGMTPERAKEAFETGVYHDKLKTEYCEKNKIPLCRIKYTDIENVEKIVLEFLQSISVLRKDVVMIA